MRRQLREALIHLRRLEYLEASLAQKPCQHRPLRLLIVDDKNDLLGHSVLHLSWQLTAGGRQLTHAPCMTV